MLKTPLSLLSTGITQLVTINPNLIVVHLYISIKSPSFEVSPQGRRGDMFLRYGFLSLITVSFKHFCCGTSLL